MLFIDTQQYLDLYRMNGGRALLGPLAAVKGKVFVTAQVVDEVSRRKLEIAASWLAAQFKDAPTEFNERKAEFREMNKEIPEHLFTPTVTAALNSRLSDFRKAAGAMQDRLKEFKRDVKKAVGDLLEQISTSKDEVSRALAELFERPVEATPEELEAARCRRERGSAPGKKTDPLGDQISWEQILTRVKDCERLWIISRDGDYTAKYGDRTFLNAAMHQELKRRSPAIEVRCFSEMEKGLRDCINATTVVPEAQLLPSEEAAKINREQEALPPLGWNPASGDISFMSGSAPLMSGSNPYGSGVPILNTSMTRPGPFYSDGTTAEPIWTGSGSITPTRPLRTSD
jgi:hypothetical protein